MKKIMYTLFVLLLMIPWANATTIETSASGTFFGDNYSYLFSIDDHDVPSATIFYATLTNTSADTSNALIDRFYFNMVDNGYTVDFTVNTSGWTVGPSTGGVLFDYAGDSTQEARLANGESMTFEMEISGAPPNTFSLFTESETTNGAGAAGGDDYGQVAVRFQQLGDDGEGSDLLASYWTPVPEPATILLLGVGLVGFASSFKSRKQK